MRRRDFLGVAAAMLLGGVPKLEPEPKYGESLVAKLARQRRLNKLAQDAINDFTRSRIHEVGFLRRVVPPLPIDESVELDRCVPTSPLPPDATRIPFATLPLDVYIRGGTRSC